MNLELTPKALLSKLHSLPSHSSSKNIPLKVLVAYSGGLDSHVLLHLLSRISSAEIKLRAVYINHGLQVESNQWATHCENICNDLNISYQSIDLNLQVAKGESTEEVARKGRYKALANCISKGVILATAHHQNDQAETFLLQLFRGAGVQGLSSMPLATKFNSDENLHARPLLDFSRNDLEAYAKQYDLKHIEDPSNKDTAFDRNFLRQKIMPELRERWLGIDKTIARSANIQAETKELLDEVAAKELPDVLHKETYYSLDNNQLALAPIDISLLSTLSLSKQRLVLRYWISQQGFINPSDTKLTHIFTDLIGAAKDKQPVIEWTGVELRRYQNLIYIMSALTEHDVTQVINWEETDSMFVESISSKINQSNFESELSDANQKITIRFRQGGEKIEISKRGNISLKNLFQELDIPPWIRSRLPLIYVGEKLIKIIGLESYLRNNKRHPPTF